MTFTEEYLGDEDDLQGGSEYPSAFGITCTPRISGIAIGVLGLLGSLYLALNWLLPMYDQYQKLKTDEITKQDQITQRKIGDLDRKIEALQIQLQQKESQKQQVLFQAEINSHFHFPYSIRFESFVSFILQLLNLDKSLFVMRALTTC